MRISDWSSDVCSSDLLIHDYPDQWANAYISFGLGDRDPVRRACGQSFQGFIWREIGRLISLTRGDLKMLSIGREHGIADGFTVPRHLPSQVIAACPFAVGPGPRLQVDRKSRRPTSRPPCGCRYASSAGKHKSTHTST